MFSFIVYGLKAQCSSSWNESIETGHVTWTSLPQSGLCGTIDIQKGATLEIKTPVTFGDWGKINIRPGGTLILRDQLTSCDRWIGIRIFGDGDDKGRLEAYDGSIIEHAIWGISTTAWNKYLGEGEIDCKQTIFRNNGVAVMLGTRNGPSVDCISVPYTASFYDCDFITDNNLRHGKFWVFITTYNLNVVHHDSNNPYEQNHVVNGCRFTDLQTNSTFANPYNAGVVALNGNVDIIYSTFENLFIGVEARFLCRDFPIFIDGTGFDNCGVGVLNSGMSNPTVTWNYTTLADQTTDIVSSQTGVLLQDYMTGVKVENNYFGRKSTATAGSIGIYTNSIGSMNNKIRKNHFWGVDVGNIAVGDNANTAGGLYYLCNTNHNNRQVDFMAYNGYAIRDNQGLSQGPAYLATGNSFSNHAYHFFNLTNGGAQTAEYYYSADQKPINYFGLNLNKRQKATHCLVEEELTLDELKEAIATRSLVPAPKINLDVVQNELNYQEHWALYLQAKDDFESVVNSGNESLIKKERATMLSEKEAFAYFANLGYEYAMFESKNIDDARLWLGRFNNPTGDYLLAGSYWETGELNQALSVLNDISVKYTLTEKQYVDNQKMISIYSAIAENGESVMENKEFIQELESYAVSKEGKSCFLARTLLRGIGQYYAPILDIPEDVFVENRSKDYSQKKGSIAKKISVFPNPTNGMVVFDLADFSGELDVVVRDVFGKFVVKLPVNKNENSAKWSPNEVINGLYFYQVLEGGKLIDSGSFIIQK